MIQGKYKYITDEFISGTSNHYEIFIDNSLKKNFSDFRKAQYDKDSFEIHTIDNNYKGLIVHGLNYCRQDLSKKP